jgi:hypothetical protein
MSTFTRLFRGFADGRTANDERSWGESPSVTRPERRSSPRYFVTANHVLVGWWVGELFRSTDAYADDVSSGGAMILTTELPAQQHVWIALAKPQKTRWYPAKVVWVRESSYGLFRVGLAFNVRGESNFFKALRIRSKECGLFFERYSIRRLFTSSSSLHAESSESSPAALPRQVSSYSYSS